MAGSIGDGGMRERFFLFVLDGHVIAIEASEDEQGYEKEEDIVDMQCSKEWQVQDFLLLALFLLVVDDEFVRKVFCMWLQHPF